MTQPAAFHSAGGPTAAAEVEKLRPALEQGAVNVRLSKGWTHVGLEGGKPDPGRQDRCGFRFEHTDGAKLSVWLPRAGWGIWPEPSNTCIMRGR